MRRALPQKHVVTRLWSTEPSIGAVWQAKCPLKLDEIDIDAQF